MKFQKIYSFSRSAQNQHYSTFGKLLFLIRKDSIGSNLPQAPDTKLSGKSNLLQSKDTNFYRFKKDGKVKRFELRMSSLMPVLLSSAFGTSHI